MRYRLLTHGIRLWFLTMVTIWACPVVAQSSTDTERDQPAKEISATTDVPRIAPASDSMEAVPAGKILCNDDNQQHAMIDRLRSRLYKLTCSSASWFDGLFGNTRYDEDYRATHGSLTTGALWSQRKSFEKTLRYHVRMYLPQANQRLHAFVGRVDREDYVSESQPDVYGLPKVFDRDIRETNLAGIGYNEPLKKRGSFDVGTGVHLSFPLDPYVKGSYRFARPVGERNLLHLRETAFWENQEGFGVTSTLDWDHIVGDKHLLRFTTSGTFSEASEGLRWFSNFTLFQFLSGEHALAYELAANGSLDHEVPLADYGGSIVLRQRVWRDWLLLELRGGIDWPRDFLYEHRRSNLNAGLAFELRFGNEPSK